jgi:Na+-translocating ferredoxin:NAD+ oxidoreductase RNF subunit RnfB
MDQLITAAALMAGLTLVLGSALALAHRFFRVEEDPRLAEIEALLGGTNCGACGKPGCRPFAEALIAGDCVPGQCTVSPPASIARIAELLGVAAGEVEKRVARLHCAGGRSAVRQLARYEGVATCAAAFKAQRGGRACGYGCLGEGDCEAACEFDAIAMSQERLPVVDPDACTACGDCVDACPADLFSLAPVSWHVIVQCSSPLTGELARSTCSVACDACGRCALDAPPGVIEMEAGLPRLRRPAAAPPRSVQRCPTGAIAWVDGPQFDYDVPLAALTRQQHG